MTRWRSGASRRRKSIRRKWLRQARWPSSLGNLQKLTPQGQQPHLQTPSPPVLSRRSFTPSTPPMRRILASHSSHTHRRRLTTAAILATWSSSRTLRATVTRKRQWGGSLNWGATNRQRRSAAVSRAYRETVPKQQQRRQQRFLRDSGKDSRGHPRCFHKWDQRQMLYRSFRWQGVNPCHPQPKIHHVGMRRGSGSRELRSLDLAVARGSKFAPRSDLQLRILHSHRL